MYVYKKIPLSLPLICVFFCITTLMPELKSALLFSTILYSSREKTREQIACRVGWDSSGRDGLTECILEGNILLAKAMTTLICTIR
jgi:hypothetical protein